MAKHQEEPITAEAITRFLGQRDDFAFEMRVLHTITSTDSGATDLSVEFGGSYADSVTGKSRQFDIRASMRNGNKIVRMAVECKQLRSAFPLVVSRCPRPRNEAYHHLVVAEPRKQIHEFEGRPTYHTARSFYSGSAYTEEAPVGKGSTQLGIHAHAKNEFISTDSDIYEKWAQALSSAEDLIMGGIRDWDIYGKGNQNVNFLSAVLPILVIPDGTLWVVDYNSEGERTAPPTQVETTEFYVGKIFRKYEPKVRFEITHLHIFTCAGFKSFLESSFVKGELWNRFFPYETRMGEINWYD